MKRIVKKIAIIVIKILSLIKSWITIPMYAKSNNLTIRSQYKKPLIVNKFEGVFNGIEERERSLRKIITLLEELDVDYFLVPHLSRKIGIAVMAENRQKVLELLNKNDDFTGYYAKILKDKHNVHIPKLISLGILSKNDTILAIDIYRHTYSGSSRIVYGYDFAISLEFWEKAEDLSKTMFKRSMDEAGIMDKEAMQGAIVAPTANGVAKVFASSAQKFKPYTFGSIKSKTLEIFTNKMLGQVNFPIDVVYTWVDGNDSEWQKKFLKAKKELDPNYNNNSMSRYTDHEELRYSLRSIEMYAPWVNKIYIVTDNQVPKWLKQNDKVKVVDHKEIFTDASALPVFNSHAIESQLHHIEGLSEHFLYLNDDILFGSHVKPEDFFLPNGIARLLPSSATIGTGVASSYETAPSSAGKNVRQLIENYFGVFATNKFRHAPYPQIKSVSYEIEKLFTNEVERTMKSKFRKGTDVSYTSSLTQNFLLASGNGVAYPYKTTTINVSESESKQEINDVLKNGNSSTICLNESVTSDSEISNVEKRACYFLESYYPYMSYMEESKNE